MEASAELTIPQDMFAILKSGTEMSVTLDDDIPREVGERFLVGCFESSERREIEVLRVVRGPAIEVFAAVLGEPAQSGASVLDAISGLALTGRPPTTVVTFLRVRAVQPMPN